MTRRIRVLVTTLTTALVTALLVVPAAATEEGHDAAASGFGTGQWDGLIAAAIAGVALGILVYALSDPGGIPDADHHHASELGISSHAT